MGNAVEYEGVGRLFETYTFVEASGIFLGLDVDVCCIEMLNGRINGVKHDLLAVTFAAFGGDDPADGDLLHVGFGRAYSSQCDNLAFDGQP